MNNELKSSKFNGQFCHSFPVRSASARKSGTLSRSHCILDGSSCFTGSFLSGHVRVLLRLVASSLLHDVGTEEVGDYVDIRRHNLSLVPILGKSVKDLGDLAVVLLLVHCSEVCHHEVSDRNSLRPCAGHFDIRKVDLLTRRITIRCSVRVKRRQLIGKMHLHRCGLLLETSRCTKPEDIASLFSHDDRVRIACSDLDGLVTVQPALLEIELAWRKLRLKGSMTELAMGVPAPGVNLTES